MIKKWFFLAFLLNTFLAQAQQEVSMPMLDDVPNRLRFNPAFVTGYKWTVSLPSLSHSLATDGPAVRDLLKRRNDGTYSLRLSQVINSLPEVTSVVNINKFEWLGISREWDKSAVFVNLGTRALVQGGINKDLAKLLVFGNGQYIGDTLNIGSSLNALAFTELALGTSYQLGKIRIGAAAKWLFGLGAVHTSKDRLLLYTDPEYYQLTAISDFEIQAASAITLDSTGNFSTDWDKLSTKLHIGQNTGLAFDLGIVWQLTDRLSLHASAIDIGSINWKENAHLLKSQGTNTFDGLTIKGLGDVDSTSFTQALDTLRKVFDFEQEEKSFTSPLDRKILAGATYRYGNTTLNALLDLTNFGGKTLPAFSLGARTYVNKKLGIGGVLSYNNGRIDHLGINVTTKLGPVQTFVVTDNVLSYLASGTAKDVHLRAGVNLVFGKKDEPAASQPQSKRPGM